MPLKRLNEQVKRNRDRFPEDFMFQVTLDEGKAILLSRSQIATLKRGQNIQYRPYAFTEHGAVMLAKAKRIERAFAQFERGEFFSPEASRADMEQRKAAWLREHKAGWSRSTRSPARHRMTCTRSGDILPSTVWIWPIASRASLCHACLAPGNPPRRATATGCTVP